MCLVRRAAAVAFLLGIALAAAGSCGADHKKSNDAPQIITFDDLRKLLREGKEEEEILQILNKSTIKVNFVLGDDQIKQLKKMRVSDEFIAALKKKAAGTPTAAQVENVTDIAIVLDCSLSMLEKIGDQTKWDVAKEAVKNLIASIGDERRVAFLVYGHVEGEDHKCDVEVKRPMAGINAKGKAELVQIIDELVPRGNTPIGKSLQYAGKELAKNPSGLHALILITDGIETCNGEPDVEAAKLTKNLNLGNRFRVIGLGLEDKERDAVEKIAKAGKGKYYDGQKAEQVVSAFEDLKKEVVQAPKKEAKAEKVVSKRRAIKVLEPDIKFPAMMEIHLIKGKAVHYRAREDSEAHTAKYGEDLPVASDAKFEVWWVPKDADAIPVRMMNDFSLKRGETVEIKPEQYLGLVRVSGKGYGEAQEIIISTKAATKASAKSYVVQTSKAYGKDMVVPAGKYKVWIFPKKGDAILVEEELEVKAGKLIEVE